MFPGRRLGWSRRVAAVGRSRGLRWGAGFAAILGCSLLAMFGLMFWRSTVLLFETLDRSVMEQLELLSARPPDMLPFMIESRMHRSPEVLTRVGLFDQSGTRLVGDIAEIPAALVFGGPVQAVLAPLNPSRHWRAAAKRLPDGRALVVARNADEILAVRTELWHGAALGIVPAVLLSLGGGALVGIATERRLRRLNEVAERIIEGDLHQRLPESPRGDELDRLCGMVNRMLSRLDELVDALQATGENIAHDLRTPLTSLRARLERTLAAAGPNTQLGPSIEKSILSVDQALSIVTALLRISEIRHGRRLAAFERFDLAEVLCEVAEAYRPVAEDKGIVLTCSVNFGAMMTGDRQLIVEAVVNLVDNAVKFTHERGHVWVTLEGSPGHPRMMVADDGPGIPAAIRADVFRRFYRAETSRTTAGNGLGLSLVDAILRLHGFTVVLHDNDPGCRIEVRLWNRETEVAGAAPLPDTFEPISPG